MCPHFSWSTMSTFGTLSDPYNVSGAFLFNGVKHIKIYGLLWHWSLFALFENEIEQGLMETIVYFLKDTYGKVFISFGEFFY